MMELLVMAIYDTVSYMCHYWRELGELAWVSMGQRLARRSISHGTLPRQLGIHNMEVCTTLMS